MIKRYYEKSNGGKIEHKDGNFCFWIDVKSQIEPPSKVPCPECKNVGHPDCRKCEYGPDHPYNPDACTGCVCSVCNGYGYIYKYYTPAERDQWREENHLPPEPWVGAVWVRIHAHDGIRSWHLKQQNDVVDWIKTANDFISTCPYAGKWKYEVVLAIGNTPPPKDDYRHGGK